MLRKDSGDTRLILIALPGELARHLRQMRIDDSNEKYLILTFPDSTRYQLPGGRETGQALKLR